MHNPAPARVQTSPGLNGIDHVALRPAFRTNTQAFSFLVLIIAALALPVLIEKSGRITRRDSYEMMPESRGPYTFVENEIFNNREDVDIVFLGNSVTWAGVDTPVVQSALTSNLQRPVRVVTFGSNWAGMDVPYHQIEDALASKRVHLVVLSIPRIEFDDEPTPSAAMFLPQGEYGSRTTGLPLKYKFVIYAGNVLRAPHDLLTLVRTNRSKPSPYADTLGHLSAEEGWGKKRSSFQRFTANPPSIPTAKMIYSAESRDHFQFAQDSLPAFHQYYLRKLIDLLNRKHVPLMLMNIPQYSERHNARVLERAYWPKELGVDVPIVGVAPLDLFAGLSEDQIKFMYYDEHLNANGSEFFTRTITPAILKVYSDYVEKR